MGWNDFSTIRERSLSDLLAAERQIRERVEAENQQLTAMLVRLAQKLDGTRLEEYRRMDPTAPKSWTAKDWRVFFEAFTRVAPASWSMSETSVGGQHGLKQESLEAKDEIRQMSVEDHSSKGCQFHPEQLRFQDGGFTHTNK
jgi:hypothetical protein